MEFDLHRFGGLACLICCALVTANCSFAQDPKPKSKDRDQTRAKIDLRKTKDGVLFLQQSDPILKYQREPVSKAGKFERSNYVHPLYDFDGNVLTEDFPSDHLHHRGIFWAWHQVIVGDKTAGDSWLTSEFAWKNIKSRQLKHDDGSATLVNLVDWTSAKIIDRDGNLIPFVREQSSITVHPATNRQRAIDFEIKLLPLVDDVKIGGSNDVKGYGGFSPRLKMPDDLEFLSAGGKVVPKTTAVEAGNWIDMIATFGKEEKRSGVMIMVHPDSSGFPQTWILRQKGSMQNPVYPGRKPVALSKDKPVFLRYRILIHAKVLNNEQRRQNYRAFAKTKPLRPIKWSTDRNK